MPIHNADIAAIFEQIADLLNVEGANIYRIRAYRNAARLVKELGTDLKEMAKNGENLTQFAGIGKNLSAKIEEIAETGKCSALEKLEKELPPAVTELLKIPELGPKRVKMIYQELDVHTVEQLQRAILDGRLGQLPGFGANMEAKIAAAVDIHTKSTARLKRATAAQYAEPLTAYLRNIPGVKQVIIAGSYRRAAVHSRFDLSRERQTERILPAMDHPHFSIFAHPSGRLIDQPEPYDVDMSRIIRKAKSRGCFLELDAQPQRLDLIDIYCQMAKAESVLISIDSDSHSALDFQNLRFGIGQARRGWLEKEDVLNTRPLRQLRRLLQCTM